MSNITNMQKWIAHATLLGLHVDMRNDREHQLLYVFYTSELKNLTQPRHDVTVVGYDSVDWLGIFNYDEASVRLTVFSHVSDHHYPQFQKDMERFRELSKGAKLP